MSFSLVPFEARHLDTFVPGLPDRAGCEGPYLAVLRRYWPGRAICAVRDGWTLGIAGVSVVNGCAYPWMLLSDEMRRAYPVRLTRLARRVLDRLFATEGVSRIEVHVDRMFWHGCKWIERLGFRELHSTHPSTRYIRYGLSRASDHTGGADDDLHDRRRRCSQ